MNCTHCGGTGREKVTPYCKRCGIEAPHAAQHEVDGIRLCVDEIECERFRRQGQIVFGSSLPCCGHCPMSHGVTGWVGCSECSCVPSAEVIAAHRARMDAA